MKLYQYRSKERLSTPGEYSNCRSEDVSDLNNKKRPNVRPKGVQVCGDEVHKTKECKGRSQEANWGSIKDKMEVSETEGHLPEEDENPYLDFLKASES